MNPFYHIPEITSQHGQITPMLHELVRETKNLVGFSAAGICLFDEENNNPYQALEGFIQSFYALDQLRRKAFRTPAAPRHHHDDPGSTYTSPIWYTPGV